MHPHPHNLHGTPHESGERPLSWQLFVSFHRAMHTHRQLMIRMMAERGIPPAQALCLRALGHNDGLTQRDLAEMLNTSRPTITVMLQKMEKSALIERRTDESDQRFTRIYLTEQGWALHQEMHRLLDGFVAETGGRLAEDEQRELARLLDLLNGHMCQALEERGTQAAVPGPDTSLTDKDGA